MRLRIVYEIDENGERSVYAETKDRKLEILAYDFKFLTEMGEQVRLNSWGTKKARESLLKNRGL